MQSCGQGSCIGSITDTAAGGSFAQCGATCIEEQTDFSSSCSGCFGEILACTMRECGTEALGSLTGNRDALDACIAEKCDDDFSACAGISLNDR